MRAERLCNANGFSLVEAVVVIGLISAGSLILAQLSQNSVFMQESFSAGSERLELGNDTYFITSDKDSCTASLAGTTFKGSMIKTTPTNGLSLWYADEMGARSRKAFDEGLRIGKLKIDKIGFTMPDYAAGVNWPVGSGQSFRGVLTISGVKVVGGQEIPFKAVEQPINVTFNTNGSGTSTITECTTQSSGGASAGIGVPKAVFYVTSTGVSNDIFGNATLVSHNQNVYSNTVTLRISFSGLPPLTNSNFVVLTHSKLTTYYEVSRINANTIDISFWYADNSLDASGGFIKASVSLWIN